MQEQLNILDEVVANMNSKISAYDVAAQPATKAKSAKKPKLA